MPLESVVVTGAVCLVFLVFGLALAYAERQTQKAAATRARRAATAGNDNESRLRRAA